MLGWWTDRKRDELRAQPFPEARAAWLHEHVALYQTLNDDERTRLHGHMQILLAEKPLDGCDGLVVTDDMRYLVAAQAALLILNLDSNYYPKLDAVLLYPAVFRSPQHRPRGGGVVEEFESSRLGESWNRGVVVLSWKDAEQGARTLDGRNVVLHEFAHQLDQADGVADGWPIPFNPRLEKSWYRIMHEEFGEHVSRVKRRRKTRIDPYGATNPAEFFAVLTEMFFERPAILHEHHNDLYRLLQEFYQQDPEARLRD